MKRSSTHWSLLIVVAAATSTYASQVMAGGSTVGNGGDAVVCRWPHGAIQSAEVLDLYEARKLRGMSAVVPNHLSSPEAILGFVIERFAEVDPQRSAQYQVNLSEFLNDATFTDDELQDIPDHGDLPLKPHCAIEQFVIQKKPRFREDKTYLIQAGIWQHFEEKQNALQLAAIMLHEVVYTDFIEHGHENSESTRYFNSALFSGSFNSYSQDEYLDLLESLGLL